MKLPLILSLILILAGLWSLIVWPPFLRRVLKDPRSRNESGRMTRFLIVHLMLISISLVLGIATGVIGIRALIAG
ncbi:SCO4848 family membrane protein [Psychromicrobium sp. YIM B11713]|uniref:SCO4848 family membrane protein n=1 Tax=Psychromicrobium sp. YIM B11713 TaxID=3145233 RepID=UPI00374F9DC5